MKNLFSFDEFVNESLDQLSYFRGLGTWDKYISKITFSSGVQVKMDVKDVSKNKTLMNKIDHLLRINGWKDLSRVEAIELLSIYTPEEVQNKGLATDAINDIIKVADDNGLVLYLEAIPIGNKAMSPYQLAGWYESFGFRTVIGGKNPKMIRVSKKK